MEWPSNTCLTGGSQYWQYKPSSHFYSLTCTLSRTFWCANDHTEIVINCIVPAASCKSGHAIQSECNEDLGRHDSTPVWLFRGTVKRFSSIFGTVGGDRHQQAWDRQDFRIGVKGNWDALHLSSEQLVPHTSSKLKAAATPHSGKRL